MPSLFRALVGRPGSISNLFPAKRKHSDDQAEKQAGTKPYFSSHNKSFFLLPLPNLYPSSSILHQGITSNNQTHVFGAGHRSPALKPIETPSCTPKTETTFLPRQKPSAAQPIQHTARPKTRASETQMRWAHTHGPTSSPAQRSSRREAI
jgi:hypothetical protein